MKYGLPYKGSKNKLATRIVELLPKRKNLVDLFCGGCAVTHAAMLTDKFEHIIINDLNPMCPSFFLDVLAGKYKDDRRWISREDFHRLKATDPYVAFVWSFGNNLKDYLYGEKIEPLKRAVHYAICFHDYEPAREFGLELSFIEPIEDEYERYLTVKHYIESLGDAFFLDKSERASCKISNGGSVSTKRSPAYYQENMTRVNILNKIGGGGTEGLQATALHGNSNHSQDWRTSNATMLYRNSLGG